MNSIRLKSAVFFASVFVMAGLVCYALAFQASRAAIANAVEEASSRSHQAIQARVRDESNRLAFIAKMLADRPGTKTIFAADEKTIRDHLLELKDLVKCSDLALADMDGKVLASTSNSIATGGQISVQAGTKLPEFGTSTGAAWINKTLNLTSLAPVQVGSYTQAYICCLKGIDQQLAKEIGNVIGGQMALYVGDQLITESHSTTQLTLTGTRVTGTDSGNALVGELSPIMIGDLRPMPQIAALVYKSQIESQFSVLRDTMILAIAIGLLVGLLSTIVGVNGVLQAIEGITLAAQRVSHGEWPRLVPRRNKDEIGQLYLSFNDMTATLEDNNSRLLGMLHIDALTQLWNERAVREKIEQVLLKVNPTKSLGTLIRIDIDHFEEINVQHGTAAGDAILVEAANTLKSLKSESDIVGRIGADVFLIFTLCDEPDKLVSSIQTAIPEKTGQTVSIGFTERLRQSDRFDIFFLAAKVACDQAKNAGRNCARRYDYSDSLVKTKDLRQFLQQGSYSAILALAQAVDAKDEYTRGHSRRVAEYAKGIAECAGFDTGLVDLVWVTAELHDVGKIGVPDSVLKKEGKLTEEEFAEIKKHPEQGERIVSQIPQLADTIPGIRSHHERWDGRGYPDKLVGENIPLIARIISLADTYDAMTSDRPYRKGMEPDIAAEEIRKSAGTQFDPGLIEAFGEWYDSLEVKKAA